MNPMTSLPASLPFYLCLAGPTASGKTAAAMAVKGGVGFSKNAGNYANSMLAAKEAKEKGYDQVLWTDGFEHKWLQEVGMMNIMFIIDGVAVTPDINEGTVLNGVTRNSIIVMLQEMGFKVEERKISIDEVVDAYKKGTLRLPTNKSSSPSLS